MKAPLFVHPLTDTEREQVKAGLRSSAAFTRRRCQILLASAGGATASQIARQVGCSDQAVRNAIKAFNQRGLAALTKGSSRPHTTRERLGSEGAALLQALLHQSPRTFGHSTSLWTLELAAEVSFAQGLTPSGSVAKRSARRWAAWG